MDEHRHLLRNLQPEEGQPDSGTGKHEASVNSRPSEEAPRSHEDHSPVEKERSSIVEGLVSEPLLLEQRAGRRMTYGEIPTLPLIKHLLYMEALEKSAKLLRELYIWPWSTNREKANTVERVMPAAVKGLDVEQQAEGKSLQLPEQGKEQPKV